MHLQAAMQCINSIMNKKNLIQKLQRYGFLRELILPELFREFDIFFLIESMKGQDVAVNDVPEVPVLLLFAPNTLRT